MVLHEFLVEVERKDAGEGGERDCSCRSTVTQIASVIVRGRVNTCVPLINEATLSLVSITDCTPPQQ